MRDEHRRIARFIFTGVASTGVYFALLILLQPVIPATLWLTALCYSIAMCLNFLAQGLFTFRTQRLSRKHLGRYIVMQGSALAMNSLTMALLVDVLNVPLLLAQVFVTGIITIAVYLLSRTWVFA